jgi:hypothetical protein
MMSAIEKAGLPYRFALTGPDHHVRTSAVAAGLGIIAMPLRLLVSPLVVAKEYYLPALDAFRSVIVVREDFDTTELKTIIDALKMLAPSAQIKSVA